MYTLLVYKLYTAINYLQPTTPYIPIILPILVLQ